MVLANNPDLSILAVNGFKGLFLFHTVHYQGQNLFCTKAKLLGLSGGGARADCYRLDPLTLFQDIEIQTLSWRGLKGALTPEAVDALQVADQNPSVFKGKLGMIVPPLVLTSMLEAETMNPAELIPILLVKFQEFDRSSPVVKACMFLRLVLKYLWAVHKKLFNPSIFSLDRNADSQTWANRMHFANIMMPAQDALPPPFPLPPPPQASVGNQSALEIIADNIRVIREATERQHLREAALEDKKDQVNRWDKIPEVVQRMILKLSAISEDALPPSLCDTYMHVLKQLKALGAAMVLNIELLICGCQVKFQPPWLMR
jgi:hypothetical protein